MKIFSFIRRQMMPLVVLCCFASFGSQSAHAGCNVVLGGSGVGALDNMTVLILQATITGDCSSLEALQAQAAPLGLNVEIDDDAAWGAKTQAQFATYRAIILGDPNCVLGTVPITAAQNNGGTWGPAIIGPIAVVGTDPEDHFSLNVDPQKTGAAQLTQNAIAYAVSGGTVGGIIQTGAYISLSCYYTFSPANTSVPVLAPFGAFAVIGNTSPESNCASTSTIVAPTNALVTTPNDLSLNNELSGWHCSAHDAFQVFPSSFTPVVKTDGQNLPYILTGTPPTTSQAQSTPAPTSPTTDTTVSTVFNSAAGQRVQNDVIVPPSSNLTFPSVINPATLKFQSVNTLVSNANPYTGGGPFATFVPFDHAGNDAVQGGTGIGSKYEVRCSDATHPPAEDNCPSPSTTAPAGTHIRAKDIFDLPKAGGSPVQPTICQSGVACGTTASFAHWFQHTPGTGPTSWSPSSTSPHPACTNVTMPGFACDLEDILVNLYGDPTGFGSDLKKGDYFLGYNVPMLLSAVKVNGTSVNTPGIQGSSPFFVQSPLTFDFTVTPAQCPTGTGACANNWVAAPVSNLFYTFNSLPAPDLPGITDLADSPTCFAGSVNCPVSSGNPGASPTAPVEFTSTPASFGVGQYLLQWSAADTVHIRERYITIIPTGSATPCPNPFSNEGPFTPPCYSTKLFNAQINVFTWSGFLPPVNNLPTLNTVKAGSAVPVKFSLGGNFGLNIFAQGFPVSYPIACDGTAPTDAIEQTVTAGQSSLSFDPNSLQYTYVWKTQTGAGWTAGTCRQLQLKFAGGNTSEFANFKFK